MNTAGVVVEAIRVCDGVEWLTWRGGDKPLWPLAEELEDGVDPDGQHDRHDDDLVHVGDVYCEEVALTRYIPQSYHQVLRNVFAVNSTNSARSFTFSLMDTTDYTHTLY